MELVLLVVTCWVVYLQITKAERDSTKILEDTSKSHNKRITGLEQHLRWRNNEWR